MYWLGYEQLAQALDQRDDEGQTSYMLKSFAAGAGAGMAAAFLTTPFDVIKTRRQVALPGDRPSAATGGAAAAGGTAAAATALPRCVCTRIWGFIVDIARQSQTPYLHTHAHAGNRCRACRRRCAASWPQRATRRSSAGPSRARFASVRERLLAPPSCLRRVPTQAY